MEFVCRGCEDGVAEELLRQGAHGVRPLAEHSEIARGGLSLRLLLQQVKVAAEHGERRAQVVGNIREGGGQLGISAVQPQTLPAERLKLPG